MCVIAAAAGVGAVGSIAGAAISSSASQSAAQTQANAANNANATSIYEQQQAINEQNQMYDTEAGLENPTRISGNYAQQALEMALGLPETNLSSVTLPDGTVIGGNSPLSSLIGNPTGTGGLGAQSTGGAGINGNLYANPVIAARSGQQLMPGSGQTAATPTAANPTTAGAQASGTMYGLGQGTGTAGTGTSATSPLSSLFTPFSYSAAQFQQSPGYQFALQQGQQSLLNQATATGMASSPNTMEALDQYTVGLADQEYQQQYQNAYNAYTQNQNNVINALGSMAGYGNTATSQMGNAATTTGSGIASTIGNTASNISANTIGAGNAIAAGQVGSANAISGGLSNLSSSLNQAYLYNNLLSQNGGGSAVGLGSGGSYYSMNGDTPTDLITDYNNS
jgi:hypothetical protein